MVDYGFHGLIYALCALIVVSIIGLNGNSLIVVGIGFCHIIPLMFWQNAYKDMLIALTTFNGTFACFKTWWRNHAWF